MKIRKATVVIIGLIIGFLACKKDVLPVKHEPCKRISYQNNKAYYFHEYNSDNLLKRIEKKRIYQGNPAGIELEYEFIYNDQKEMVMLRVLDNYKRNRTQVSYLNGKIDIVSYELKHFGEWNHFYARFNYDGDQLKQVTFSDDRVFTFEWNNGNIVVMNDIAPDGSRETYTFDRFDDKHNWKKADFYKVLLGFDQHNILDFLALNTNNVVCAEYNKFDKTSIDYCNYIYDEVGNVLQIDSRFDFIVEKSVFSWDCN